MEVHSSMCVVPKILGYFGFNGLVCLFTSEGIRNQTVPWDWVTGAWDSIADISLVGRKFVGIVI